MRAATIIPASILAVAMAAAAGCGSAPARPGIPSPDARAVRAGPFSAAVAEHARALLGVPYLYGGASPSGMDCSGLVSFVYSRHGVAVPRTALAQQQHALRVDFSELAPGDLVFFRFPQPHVGVFVGGGEFIHAPGSGRAVSIARLEDPYFLLAFAGGGRYRP